MIDIYINIAGNLFIFAIFGWAVSLITKNVTHVDSMWSIFFVIAYITAMQEMRILSYQNIAVLFLVMIWSARLTAYLSIRNFGSKEDIRYQEIRSNNEPNFKFKSLYIIFIFQAVLAMIISLPLIALATSSHPYGMLDMVGLGIVIFGILYETVADYQLKQFVKGNHRGVLDTGLWRYSRHPNYFGEFLVWWGFYIISFGSGHLIAIFSPILMTWLLLKFSGIGRMESTISGRRPGYKIYAQQTSSFIPWPRKK
tara:strand:+ start:69 stop:830 length:762 start_codon:yes stop_codon:yes gene_type:complete